MKWTVALLLIFIASISFAQVGRYEQPVDTLPIGGKTQEIRESQMQGQDELMNQLVALRDSVSSLQPKHSASANADSKVSLEDRKIQLDQIIKGLNKTQSSPELMKKGYSLLDEIRREIRPFYSPAKR